jgi:hypothetical protein
LITAEAKTRGDADTKLTSDFAQVVLDRKAAITQKQKDRKPADDALGVRIDEEKARAEDVEFAHFAFVDNKLAEETARVMTRENGLQNQVNFIKNSDAAH